MASVLRNPALVPLFAAVGLGVGGGLWFGAHMLRNSSDVVIDKRRFPDPWNNVQQGLNTKLYSPNTAFWAGRAGMADPRAAFMQVNGESVEDGRRRLERAQKARDEMHKSV